MVLVVLVLAIGFVSCSEGDLFDVSCDCEYVTYDNGVETFRSSWDASCDDEVLNTSTYTYSDGSTVTTVTKIECR